MEFSIIKGFPLGESKNIEFRAGFFNLFNHVNFANPISNLNAFASSGGLANTNTEILTAGDGTLTLTSHDVGCITGIVTFHGTGHYTVTGGTGRYAGATGRGTLDGRVNLLTSTCILVATGSLTLTGH